MAGQRGPGELGLFVLWENARHLEERILADLRRRFDVVRIYEIRWTPGLVTRNFERFYSDLDVRGVYHVLNKGPGPFLGVTVIDPQPSFERRMTSRGERRVNARFLEAKQQYRDWTRGLEVHCGETPHETHRDLIMLLGTDVQSDLADIEASSEPGIVRLNQDLTGATGWTSALELFRALAHSVNYVLLNGSELPAGPGSAMRHEGFDLLTDEYRTLHTVLNARPLLQSAPKGGSFRVLIGGEPIEFRIRFVGDQYFDPRWAGDLLASRVLDARGVYRLSEQNQFETLAYRALVLSPFVGAEAFQQLSGRASRLGITEWPASAIELRQRAKALLDKIMKERSYTYVQPLDPGVFYNFRLLGFRRATLRQRTMVLRRYLSSTARRLAAPILSGYWNARDGLLLRAPWVRAVKRFVTTNPFARSG